MRKALAAAVPAALVAATAGLSAGAQARPAEAVASKAAKPNLVLDLGVDSGPFELSLVAGARAAAKKLGATLSFVAPHQADANLQSQQLSAVLAKHPSFLMIQPDDGNALIAPVRKFRQAGIPVLCVDTDVNNHSLRLGVITSDNTAGGRLGADELSKLVHAKGKVMYIGYIPGATTTDQRKRGFEARIKAYKGIDYVGPQYAQDDESEAAAKVSAVLTRDPDLAGIFASDEAVAIGAATAVQNAGKRGQVKIVAFDGAPDEVSFVKRGIIQSLIVQKAYGMGYTAVEQALAYLRHHKRPPSVTHPSYVVATKSNLTSKTVSTYLYHG